MAGKLDGKKVAILVADGFEQVEMTKPREALDEAGAETKVVSLKSGKIQGMHHADKGDRFDVDLAVDQARPEEFDALIIPGGLLNPDALRSNENALEFTRHFFREGKPVATICHGPWVLASSRLTKKSLIQKLQWLLAKHTDVRRLVGIEVEHLENAGRSEISGTRSAISRVKRGGVAGDRVFEGHGRAFSAVVA